MPFRVAIPKSVMKPTIDATDRTPPDQVHAEHAADQRKWKVQHDQQPVTRRPECCGENEEDRDDDAQREPEQLTRGLRLALELPSILDVVTLRQPNVLCNARLDVVDHASQIAARHVALHHDAALDVLAHHEIRPAVFLNRRYG